MELQKLDPKEYGLTSTKAKEISKVFKPMLDKMEELEAEYNHVVALKQSPERSELAKKVRLQYVKVRTGTAAIHKEQKTFYLSGGRFIDGWKNTQLFASEQIEKDLMQIEKHEELKEKERVAKLQEERLEEVLQYIDYEKDHATMQDPASIDLGGMDDGIYANFLAGMKLNYNQRKLAEQKAEEEEAIRLEQERQEQIKKDKEQEKIKEDNRRLAAEAAQREEENKKALAKEAAAREKVEKELQQKREKEEAEEEARQAKLKQGDKDNWADMVSDLDALKTAYSFKSKASKAKMEKVAALLEKIIDFI